MLITVDWIQIVPSIRTNVYLPNELKNFDNVTGMAWFCFDSCIQSKLSFHQFAQEKWTLCPFAKQDIILDSDPIFNHIRQIKNTYVVIEMTFK